MSFLFNKKNDRKNNPASMKELEEEEEDNFDDHGQQNYDEEQKEDWMADDRVGDRKKGDKDNNNSSNNKNSRKNISERVSSSSVGLSRRRSDGISGTKGWNNRRRMNAHVFDSMIGENTMVKDHFSLSHPSSAVAFGLGETMVFVDNFDQLILEKEEGNDYITAKHTTISSPGLMVIRILYTLVASLMSGFLFVLCVQLILFLFLGVAIEYGLTSQKGFNLFTFIGTLFAIPVFISSLSQAMVIATAFVIDTWKGSRFMKTVVNWDSTLVDWITLFVFFAFPVVLGILLLLTNISEWWTILSISWFSLVFSYYVVFAICAVYYEIDGCLELMRYHPTLRHDNRDPDAAVYSIKVIQNAILLRMKQMLSGYKHVSFHSSGNEEDPDDLVDNFDKTVTAFRTFIGPLSKLTLKSFMSRYYTVLDEPFRQYNINEILEFTPFVNRSSWGLESIYCRDRSTRYVAIVDGASAITEQQAKSSLVCFIIGFCLITLGIIGALVWFEMSLIAIVIISLLYVAWAYDTVKNSMLLYSSYNSALLREDGRRVSVNRHRPSGALYQVKEIYRISEPTPELCWVVLGLNVFLFFIIPLVALFVGRNNRVGIIFAFMCLVTLVRHVFNAPACLRELGSLDGMEIDDKREKDGLGEWREKHRFGRIIGEISVGKRSKFWSGVFVVFTIVFCGLLVSAFALGAEIEGQEGSFKFASKDDFVYENSDASKYASCITGRSIKSSHGVSPWLADMAFLSTASNYDNDSVSQVLTDWFGDTPVENLPSNVTEFKEHYQEENGGSAVSYKLINFPDQNLKVVSIRGTSNSWDTLADAQLWTSTILAQFVRAILPLGVFWNPMMPHLVKTISLIEINTLESVSYYKETTAFVNSLKNKGYDVRIVGHSLGGGLAMITGAQTQTLAVGLSGPNSMISRKTYSPEITPEALNKFTFNIVPSRDPIPRIDELAKNFQHIECRAPSNKPASCHLGRRSLCEILFTCGSEGRPIPCYCVLEFDYDEPTSLNGKVFTDACQ